MANRQLPKTIAATNAIPFDQPTTYIPALTVSGPVTFSKVTTDAQVGFGAVRRVIADGTNIPDLSAFKKIGTGEYVNTNGTVNQLWFIYDGTDYCVSITQPVAIGGGGGGDTTPPTIVSAEAIDANTIEVVFDENVTPTTVGWSYYIVDTLTTSSFSSVTGSGTTWQFTGVEAMSAGQEIQISYNSGSGNTLDTAGNELASVSLMDVTNSITGGGGSYDADAQAIIDAKTTAGVTWNTTKQDGVDAFITALKSAGIWTKSRQFGNLSDGSFAKNKINWKSPGTKDLSSESGGITYGANGTTGNGSTGFINTGINPSTEYGLSVIASAFAIYCRTAGSSDVKFDFGGGTPSPNTQIVLNAGWGTSRGVICKDEQANATTDSQGFFVVSRRGLADMELYKNGSSVVTNTVDISGGDSQPNLNLYLLAYNDNGTAALHSPREFSFWWIGDDLSDADVTAFNTAFQNLKTAFGW